MARRGRFGQVSRAAPSLTSTIIAIAREMAAQRDANMKDAWLNGGLYEGKKVTDELYLAHWKEKIAHVDKHDPLYDTYNNAYNQLDYSINESKMATLNAQGKISDTQMGQFYINWSKKIPKNSEFYRALQRDGAQWLRTGKAKSAAAAKKAAEERYQSQLQGMHDKDQVVGEYLMDVVNRMAASGNADAGISPLIGPGGQIDNFDPSDPEQMLRLVSLINLPGHMAGRPETGNPSVLFHDENGKPVTGTDVVAFLKKNDPKFAGTVTPSYFSGSIKTWRDSIGEQEALAEKTGHADNAASFNKQKGVVTEWGREANAWTVQDDYLDAKREWVAVRRNGFLAPGVLDKAFTKFQNSLIKLANDPRISGDDATRARLMAEANQVDGQPTLAESFTGLVNGEPTENSDIAKDKLLVGSRRDAIDLVASGEAVWTQGSYSADNVFTPEVGGASIGAVTREDVADLSPGGKSDVMFLPAGDGKTTIPVYVVAASITVMATDAYGRVVSGSGTVVGTVRNVYVNGKLVEEYGFTASDGVTRYTTDPFWGPGLEHSHSGGGLVLDASSLVPTDTSAVPYGPIPGSPGWTIGGKTADSKDKVTGETRPGNPGSFGMDVDVILENSAPDRYRAGADPHTDFTSPTIPLLLDARVPDGERTLEQLNGNTGFRQQTEYDNRIAAGYRLDPADPSGYSGGDIAKYNQYKAVSDAGISRNTTSSPEAMLGAIDKISNLWDRATTGTLRKKTHEDWGIGSAGAFSAYNAEKAGEDPSKLPLDKLRGTPFEKLGESTIDGSNRLSLAVNAATGFNMKLGQGLTLPSVPAVNAATGFKPTPIPTSPNAATGFTVPGSSLAGGSSGTGLTGSAAARAEKAKRDRYL